MPRKIKLFNVTEFCLKNKIEPCDFFKELNRHPKYSCKLETDKNGEYVIDRVSLMLVGDIIKARRVQKNRTLRKEEDRKNPIAAVAKEMNFLIAENKKLREEIKCLKAENEYLKLSLWESESEKQEILKRQK